MNRYPDSPKLVSLQFLKMLDLDSPGTWLGQPKLDGWRRITDNTSGQWVWSAKHTRGPAAKQLPIELRREFESLPWPEGIALDMEYVGPRCVQHVKEHSLHVFDLLCLQGKWLGQHPFFGRRDFLQSIFNHELRDGTHPHIHLVPTWTNPGLVQRFMEQVADPLSEGLVVRHRDSGLVGSFNRCAENPLMLKVKYR